jgi:hypothetical protein
VRRAIFALFLTLIITASMASSGTPQEPDEPDGIGAPQRPGPRITPAPPAPLSPEQQNKLAKDRYEKLKKDTDQLLKLATELKESVDKANQNTLSVDVIKKTEQIEKLAKSVRDKMKSY